jgi:hypothetical protein
MRFDLLDEYSTLVVPFGRGVSRKGAFQDPAVPATEARRSTIATFANHLELLRKLFAGTLPKGVVKFGREILMPFLRVGPR